MWYLNAYTLEPIAGGTRLMKSTDSNGNKLVEFIARPAIKKDAMTSLHNLKHLLESRA